MNHDNASLCVLHTDSSRHIDQQLTKISASTLNAFISTCAPTAVLQAHHCDIVAKAGGRLGLLHGKSVGIKDLFDVAGMPTTMGSEQYKDYMATEDAAVVTALRSAGAIILGKTNTHEFAYGSSGDRSWFGAVKNPHDTTRMSGGSSSGSCAAVAAGLCDMALGTDTSASVRLPAALCGVVGLKPTYDLLPRHGVFNLSTSLDHVGTITHTVADNALMLEAMTHAPGRYSIKLDHSVQGMRIGTIKRFYGEYISAAVRRAFEQALQTLENLGAAIVEIDIPDIMDIYTHQQLVLKAEAFAQHQQALRRGLPFCDEVRNRLMTGREVTAAHYLAAKQQQHQATASFDRALTAADVLLTPTCGIVAPPINERTTDINGEAHSTFWLLTRLTAPTNFSGHPSLSVPFSAASPLPIGMQLIGKLHDEATLFQVAKALEQSAT